MRVLLVDENEELREFLAATLNENTIDTATAGTPEEAVRLANDERFDAFVVDSVMGDVDGVALIEQLRNTKNGKGIPALLMSDIGTALARRIAQSAKCDFLTKPFGPTQFVEQIRALR
jgi:two-component system, OmpR family, response regulator